MAETNTINFDVQLVVGLRYLNYLLLLHCSGSSERELFDDERGRFSPLAPICRGVFERRSRIGEISWFDSVLESGRKMSRWCFTGMRYVGALQKSVTGLMLVSDSEPSSLFERCFLFPALRWLAPRDISLVSWLSLGKLSRALRNRAEPATTVMDLLSVESSNMS